MKHVQHYTAEDDAHLSDAALIAAAPDLLEALGALVFAVSPDKRDDDIESYFQEPVKAARAAIQRATGEGS